MTIINRKFKCKDDHTLYTIDSLNEDTDYYTISWTTEMAEKETDTWRRVTLEKKFENGDWYLVDDIAPKGIEGKPQSALDKQVSGNHYKDCGIQPIEYIHANGLNYFEGNSIKYITRHRKKNGKADLLKAIHYLELMIELDYPE